MKLNAVPFEHLQPGFSKADIESCWRKRQVLAGTGHYKYPVSIVTNVSATPLFADAPFPTAHS
jgi:hypothetical protein